MSNAPTQNGARLEQQVIHEIKISLNFFFDNFFFKSSILRFHAKIQRFLTFISLFQTVILMLYEVIFLKILKP
jgi:hypothetical protein